jgi:hypothetical protein
VVDELGLDETAVGGEDEGYVPCLEEAAAGPADDTDAVAVFGEDEGFVPDGTGAASAPADDSDSLAVFGQGSGFVAKPCSEAACSCTEDWARVVGGGLGRSSWCADWTVFEGGAGQSVTGTEAIFSVTTSPPAGAQHTESSETDAPIGPPIMEYLIPLWISGPDTPTHVEWGGFIECASTSDPDSRTRLEFDWTGLSAPGDRLGFTLRVYDTFGGSVQSAFDPFPGVDVRGALMWIRLRMDASDPLHSEARARVWLDGSAEPGTWQGSISTVGEPFVPMATHTKFKLMAFARYPYSVLMHVLPITITEGCLTAPDIRTQRVYFTEWGAYTIQNDLIYGDVVFGPAVGQPGHEFRGYGAIVAEPDEVQSLAAIFIYDTGDPAVIRNISYRISNLYLAITAGPDSGAALPGAIFPVPFTVYMGEGYDQFTPPTNDLTPGPGSAAIGGGSILSQSPTTYLLPDITINTDAHIFRFYIRMDNEIYIPGPRRITMVTLNPVGSPAFIERTFEVLP